MLHFIRVNQNVILATDLSPLHNTKAKAVTLQAWNGPERSRKLRFTDFMTKAHESCKVVSLTHRQALPPGITPGTHLC